MSTTNIVELVPVSEDETDQQIVDACRDGTSIASVAKTFGLSRRRVDAALDRRLPRIDGAYKRRQIALAALRLDELTEVFTKQAKTGDIEAGNLVVRFEAERRALLGLSGPSYDPTQLDALSRPGENSMAGIERSLKLIKQIEQLCSSDPTKPKLDQASKSNDAAK